MDVVTNLTSTQVLDKKLMAIQEYMGGAKKDADNPYFKSKYADLQSVKDAIEMAMTQAKTRVLIEQYPHVDYDNIIIKTIPMKDTEGVVCGTYDNKIPRVGIHTRISDPESGEFKAVYLECAPADDTPQAIGSSLTYLRRYSLMPMFHIAPEDDDGNMGSGKHGYTPQTNGNGSKQAPAQSGSKGTPAGKPAATAQAATNTGRPMTDVERKRIGLITSDKINELMAAIKAADISQTQWKKWLHDCYLFPSLTAIKTEAVDGILTVVIKNPDTIKNYKGKVAAPAPEEGPLSDENGNQVA